MVIASFFRPNTDVPVLRLIVTYGSPVQIEGDDSWFDFSYRPHSEAYGRPISWEEDAEEWARSLPSAYADSPLRVEIDDTSSQGLGTTALGVSGATHVSGANAPTESAPDASPHRSRPSSRSSRNDESLILDDTELVFGEDQAKERRSRLLKIGLPLLAILALAFFLVPRGGPEYDAQFVIERASGGEPITLAVDGRSAKISLVEDDPELLETLEGQNLRFFCADEPRLVQGLFEQPVQWPAGAQEVSFELVSPPSDTLQSLCGLQSEQRSVDILWALRDAK